MKIKRNRLAIAVAHAIDHQMPARKMLPHQQEIVDNVKFAEVVVDLPKGAGKTTMENTPVVRVGDIYRPKRANQHSKNYRVVGLRDDGSVIFARGDEVVSGTMDAAEFLAMIGKLVSASTDPA